MIDRAEIIVVDISGHKHNIHILPIDDVHHRTHLIDANIVPQVKIRNQSDPQILQLPCLFVDGNLIPLRFCLTRMDDSIHIDQPGKT